MALLSTGLTEGFHQSGVAEAVWAVEKEEAAANAFRLNYPGCTVMTDDCNLVLRLAMDVSTTNTCELYSCESFLMQLHQTSPICQFISRSMAVCRERRLIHLDSASQGRGRWNFCVGAPPARGSVE